MAGRETSAAALPPALQYSLRRVRRAAYTSDMTRAYERRGDAAGREGRVGVVRGGWAVRMRAGGGPGRCGHAP
ncbi:hypothetical protein GCM10010244_29600 [Streptomyces coeruleorubidus]|nr:hypothetical protein GCM10010244_29600 [Streptomyces bellus]